VLENFRNMFPGLQGASFLLCLQARIHGYVFQGSVRDRLVFFDLMLHHAGHDPEELRGHHGSGPQGLERSRQTPIE